MDSFSNARRWLSDHSSNSGSAGALITCGLTTPSKSPIWGSMRSFCIRCPYSSASSSAAIICERLAPVESKAPHLIRDSMTRLFTFFKSTRSQKSYREVKGPSLRYSITASMALSPTFFTAASPKRILSPSTVKTLSLELMSGGRTAMPWLRHSTIYFTTPSVVCISLVSKEAINSTGKCALR